MGMAENDPRFDWYEDPQMEEKPDEIIAQEFEDHLAERRWFTIDEECSNLVHNHHESGVGDLTIRPELESVISMTLSSIKQHQDRAFKEGCVGNLVEQMVEDKLKGVLEIFNSIRHHQAIIRQQELMKNPRPRGFTLPCDDEAVMMKGSLFKPSPFN